MHALPLLNGIATLVTQHADEFLEEWNGFFGRQLRDLVREICRTNDIEILKGHVRPEHVHLLLIVPPHLAPSRVMQAIKGQTSNRLMRDFRMILKEFWGRHLGHGDILWPRAETSPTT